jgi:hypothetical protein
MKKKITILVSIITLGLSFNGNAQAVSEGNVIIDPYYGYPNFGKTFLNSLEGVENTTVTGIGPMGLRMEYMMAPKFGLGIDFIYNSVNVSGTIDSLNSDGTVYKSYDAKIFSQRYRPQIRMNYHFVATDNLDAYFGVGVGANIRRIGTKTDYPNYDDNAVSGSLIPVSMRVALGTRYYFTENIGLNLELGLGGPFISGGVSVKF